MTISRSCFAAPAIVLLTARALAQSPDQVLVVINNRSPASRTIGEYYVHKRSIPAANVCALDTLAEESAARPVYDREIEKPIAAFLKQHALTEQILYIVLTTGIPLRIIATTEIGRIGSDGASVDSELTLLYQRMKGPAPAFPGPVNNPFFRQRDTPFRHPLFPMYLVTRLDGYNMADMKALVDRALLARNVGASVIDLRDGDTTPGNAWLRTAALLLPKDRVILDDSAAVLRNIRNVIAYASWGSNDHDHNTRFLHFQWLPGAIATEFVSTDARTFHQPPDSWKIGTWGDTHSWYAGSPQSLTADYIHEGASGASGQTDEPFLQYCPRPEFILPAYLSGRTLAESFYMGLPALSWMNLVIGDPLMRLLP